MYGNSARILLLAMAGALGGVSAHGREPPPERSDLRVHVVRSPRQAGPTRVYVSLPRQVAACERLPGVYFLPVEAGEGTRWGDPRKEMTRERFADRYRVVCVYPTFAELPWYADHPTRNDRRQESYFLKDVIPLVEKEYPVQREAAGRLLVGFSKSGWGALSLLLRHPDRFGRAAAWDAPLMLDTPGAYGSGPIFGSLENFQTYQLGRLVQESPKAIGPGRLMHFGYGNFRQDHTRMHELMNRVGMPHSYRDGPRRRHAWGSGWLPEAVEWLVGREP